MRALFFLCLLSCAASSALLASGFALRQSADVPALPEPLTNNAVASVKVGRREYVVSFNGLGEGRTHADTLASTYIYDSRSRSWSKADPVPGDVGRLASVAAAADDMVYVFGGFSVAADGTEVSTAWTHAFDPRKRTFEERDWG